MVDRSRCLSKVILAAVLGALLAVLSAAAMPAKEAGAQQAGEQVSVMGEIADFSEVNGLVGDEPETCGGIPCPDYGLTDEASGKSYGLLNKQSLKPYVGERVIVTGTVEVEGEFGGPTLLKEWNASLIKPADGGDGEGLELFGNGFSEAFYGTINDDSISGRGGDDLIKGNSGDDELQGNKGDDLLIGEAGADVVKGGPGDDALYAAYSPAGPIYDVPASPDLIFGGSGDDFIDSADRAGAPDAVYCGPGGDLVLADSEDFVADNCEVVYRY